MDIIVIILLYIFQKEVITMFAYYLAKFVSVFMAVLMFSTTPLNFILGKKTGKIANAEDNCRLSFAAVSDCHIDEKSSFFSDGMLELSLMDMEKAENKLDALVFAGDTTNHGYIEQWDIFAASMARHDVAKNIIIGAGNHDTWGPNRDDFTNPVDGVLPTFIKYNKQISGRDIDKMYYSTTINGYHFIVMGSEEDHTCAYISPEQISWLDEELEAASGDGKPIFVILHQPINGTHGLPYNWGLDKEDPPEEGGIGPQSDDVVAVLKKYDNIFFISGHIHAGFKNADKKIGVEYASVEYMKNNKGNNITLVNLPCLANPDFIRFSHFINGCGYVFETYDDYVLIRARNFGAGTWITKYDVKVDVVKAAEHVAR